MAERNAGVEFHGEMFNSEESIFPKSLYSRLSWALGPYQFDVFEVQFNLPRREIRLEEHYKTYMSNLFVAVCIYFLIDGILWRKLEERLGSYCSQILCSTIQRRIFSSIEAQSSSSRIRLASRFAPNEETVER